LPEHAVKLSPTATPTLARQRAMLRCDNELCGLRTRCMRRWCTRCALAITNSAICSEIRSLDSERRSRPSRAHLPPTAPGYGSCVSREPEARATWTTQADCDSGCLAEVRSLGTLERRCTPERPCRSASSDHLPGPATNRNATVRSWA
jgi:hypothetical protein